MINNVLGLAVNSEQEEFTAFLINILQPSSQEEFEQLISLLGEDQIKDLYRLFKTEKLKKVNMAKEGMKIDFLKDFRHRCPEGMEMFMHGGCMKCRKKKDVMEQAFRFKSGGLTRDRFVKGPTDSTSKGDAKPNKLQKKGFAFKHRFGGTNKRFGKQENSLFKSLEAAPVRISPSFRKYARLSDAQNLADGTATMDNMFDYTFLTDAGIEAEQRAAYTQARIDPAFNITNPPATNVLSANNPETEVSISQLNQSMGNQPTPATSGAMNFRNQFQAAKKNRFQSNTQLPVSDVQLRPRLKANTTTANRFSK